MDAAEGHLRYWLLDLGAATALALGVATSLMLIGHGEPLLLGASAGLSAFGALRMVQPEAARFRLRPIAVRDWTTEILPAEASDEKVVHLFGTAPQMPTAGELKRRIDRHLERRTGGPGEVVPVAPDASAALRNALADLRRSIS